MAQLPYPNRTNAEKYGSGRGQTVFRNPDEARKAVVYSLNSIFQKLPLLSETEWGIRFSGAPWWKKVNYWKKGYEHTEFTQIVKKHSQLETIVMKMTGDLVRVSQDHADPDNLGGFLFSCYEWDGEFWREIGREKGTVSIDLSIFEEDKTVFSSILEFLEAQDYNQVVFAALYEMLAQNQNCDWFFKTSYVDLFNRISVGQPEIRPQDELPLMLASLKESKPFHTKIRDIMTVVELDEKEDASLEVRDEHILRIVLLIDRLNCNVDEEATWDSGGWDNEHPWDTVTWNYEGRGTLEYVEVGRFTTEAGKREYEVSNVQYPFPIVIESANDTQVPIYSVVQNSGKASINFTRLPGPNRTFIVKSALGVINGTMAEVPDEITEGYQWPYDPSATYEHAAARTYPILQGTGNTRSIGRENDWSAFSGYDPSAVLPLGGDTEERARFGVGESAILTVHTEHSPYYGYWDTIPWDTDVWDSVTTYPDYSFNIILTNALNDNEDVEVFEPWQTITVDSVMAYRQLVTWEGTRNRPSFIRINGVPSSNWIVDHERRAILFDQNISTGDIIEVFRGDIDIFHDSAAVTVPPGVSFENESKRIQVEAFENPQCVDETASLFFDRVYESGVFTLEFDLNVSILPSTDETIISLGGNAQVGLGDGIIKVDYEITGNADSISSPINTNEWHHVTITSDGFEISLFLNGELVAQASNKNTTTFGSLGIESPATSAYKLSHVNLWKTHMGEAEVLHASKVRKYRDRYLVCSFPLDGNLTNYGTYGGSFTGTASFVDSGIPARIYVDYTVPYVSNYDRHTFVPLLQQIDYQVDRGDLSEQYINLVVADEDTIYRHDGDDWIYDTPAIEGAFYIENSTNKIIQYVGSGNWDEVDPDEFDVGTGLDVCLTPQYISSDHNSLLTSTFATYLTKGFVRGTPKLWSSVFSGREEYIGGRLAVLSSQSGPILQQITPTLSPLVIMNSVKPGFRFMSGHSLSAKGVDNIWSDDTTIFFVASISEPCVLIDKGTWSISVEGGSPEVKINIDGEWVSNNSHMSYGRSHIFEYNHFSNTLRIDGRNITLTQLNAPTGSVADDSSGDFTIGMRGLFHEILIVDEDPDFNYQMLVSRWREYLYIPDFNKTNMPTIDGHTWPHNWVNVISNGVSYSLQANEYGNFSLYVTPSSTYQLEYYSRDAMTKSATVETFIEIDEDAPPAPNLPEFRYTGNPDVVFHGTGEADAIITVYVNSGFDGQTLVEGDGEWSYMVTLPPGTHYITATATDEWGNVSGYSQPFMVVVTEAFYGFTNANNEMSYWHYTINTPTLTNMVESERMSPATYFDADIKMMTAPAGNARINFDPETGILLGLISEEQRTNLIKRTVPNGGTNGIIGNGGVLPTDWTIDGLGGDLVGEIEDISSDIEDGIPGIRTKITGTPASNKTVQQSFPGLPSATTSLGKMVLSAYVKQVRDTIHGEFSLVGGDVGDSIPNDPVGSLAQNRLVLFSDEDNTTPKYPVIENDVILGGTLEITTTYGGTNLEVGSFPTSYIPTTGDYQIRLSDNNKIKNIVSLVNNKAMLLGFKVYTRFTIDSHTDEPRTIFAFGVSPLNMSRGYINENRKLVMEVVDNGEVIVSLVSAEDVEVGETFALFEFIPGDWKMESSDITPMTDNTEVSYLPMISEGCVGDCFGNENINGHIGMFEIHEGNGTYPETLTVLNGPMPEAIYYDAPFEYVPIVVGGMAPYSFSITGTLPENLHFDPLTGRVWSSGVVELGMFDFSIEVSDSA